MNQHQIRRIRAWLELLRLPNLFTVPGDPNLPPESKAMEIAKPTWFGDQYWKQGGGGTAWDSMAYDPALDLLYVGTGNGSWWHYGARSEGKGDNLFLSSILAIRPDTGEYVWHYQTTPATCGTTPPPST